MKYNFYTQETEKFYKDHDNNNTGYKWSAITNVNNSIFKFEISFLSDNDYEIECFLLKEVWVKLFDIKDIDEESIPYNADNDTIINCRKKYEIKLLYLLYDIIKKRNIYDVEYFINSKIQKDTINTNDSDDSDDNDNGNNDEINLDLEHMTITHDGIKYNAKDFIDNYKPFNNFDPDTEMYF